MAKGSVSSSRVGRAGASAGQTTRKIDLYPAEGMSAMRQFSATVGSQAGIQVETEENGMEQSIEKIIERNLLEVFNGRDADSRRAAMCSRPAGR